MMTPGRRPPDDSEITTLCPVCSTEQALADADVCEREDETVYTCRDGCAPILVLVSRATHETAAPGYVFGGWIVRNPSELTLPYFNPQTGGLLGRVKIDAVELPRPPRQRSGEP